MRTNATRLRENLYKLLDEALASGETIEVERKGRILRIVPDRPASKLDLRIDEKVSFGSLIRIWDGLTRAGYKVGDVPARVLRAGGTN